MLTDRSGVMGRARRRPIGFVVAATVSLVVTLPACEEDQPGSVSNPPTDSPVDQSPTGAFSDLTPRFSGRGNQIVFVREQNDDSDIYVVSGGGAPHVLADLSEYDLDPAVSPDGRRVVFDSSPDGFAQLHLVPTEGGTPVALSDVGDGWATFPAWSPDGKRIVYSCGRPSYESSDLCVISSTGDFLGLLEEESETQELEPSWSPDGTTVAFASDRSGDSEIYLIDVTRGDVTRLTNDPAHDADPAWSPDGEMIAFSRLGSDGPPQVCVMGSDGAGIRCLVDGAQPSWSPDGTSLVFYAETPEGSRIFSSDISGSEITQIT